MQNSKSEPHHQKRVGNNALIAINESKRRQSTGAIKRASSCMSQHSSKLTTQHSFSKVC